MKTPKMNHDASHCLDYDEKKCPKWCYRAQLTKDLKESDYPWPTSWVHFEGTQYCAMRKENRNE